MAREVRIEAFILEEYVVVRILENEIQMILVVVIVVVGGRL